MNSDASGSASDKKTIHFSIPTTRHFRATIQGNSLGTQLKMPYPTTSLFYEVSLLFPWFRSAALHNTHGT